jgi:hypothetical protein
MLTSLWDNNNNDNNNNNNVLLISTIWINILKYTHMKFETNKNGKVHASKLHVFS